ncbi:MAG: EamA family transporter RarD, partial [Coriobacteriia bacterium]|nr:EamA family transporter RarD [Coriobacteriia bacterium]
MQASPTYQGQAPGAGDQRRVRWQGALSAAGAYALWGVLPAYWKLMEGFSDIEVLAHRLLWAAVLLVLICLWLNRSLMAGLFQNRRAVLILLAAGLLNTLNWGLFIYAINSDHILQTSIGYFTNPLMSILLGLLIFKEKLTAFQKVATVLAAIGLIYFTIDYGSFPWISLALAASFALYGAFKKIGGYPALPALAVETTLVVPLALAYVGISFFLPGRAFLAAGAHGLIGAAGWLSTLLLIGGGAVTLVPLLLFGRAVNAVPLSWMGFFQYIAPTLSLIIGTFVYHEAFTQAHAVCFGCIWAGLLLIAIEA